MCKIKTSYLSKVIINGLLVWFIFYTLLQIQNSLNIFLRDIEFGFYIEMSVLVTMTLLSMIAFYFFNVSKNTKESIKTQDYCKEKTPLTVEELAISFLDGTWEGIQKKSDTK